MTEDLRQRAYASLERRVLGVRVASLAQAIPVLAIVASVLGSVLYTLPDLAEGQRHLLREMLVVCMVVFMLEYVGRLWIAPEADPAGQARPWRSRVAYMRSFLGVIDQLVILPLFLASVLPLDRDIYSFVGLLALLKSAHYAQSLRLFAAVFRSEARALLSYLIVMLVLMVLVSIVIFALEREAQPQVFRSIPHAMWWAVVTMSTVGYGDIFPVTPLGKVFGGFTMLLGIAMFAVPAGILTNGFAAEIRKRDFVVTWRTVANVPLFKDLDAIRIADIAQLLKARVVPARQVVVRRGEQADAMYFIMAGEVEVDVPPTPIVLGEGQYFGEIGLIRESVRTATVITLDECTLLSLDVRDFRRLMDRYPDLKADLARVAEERLGEHQAGTAHAA